MGWLDKLFGREQPSPGSIQDPALAQIRFGRYSDNNKTPAKTAKWFDADSLFKEKKYKESIAAFFDYLTDEKEQNVRFSPQGEGFTFELVQGSKRVYGESNGQHITARVPVVKMATPSAAVMRRMLELNYGLYYSRTTMNDDHVISMMFDSAIDSANPNKLYYGLKELATKADRQDDILVADFRMLEEIDTQHIERLPQKELDIKYRYFRKWIEDTLQQVSELNPDSFSGSVAYLLLNLLYRIDYLIAPEAKLLADLEKINGIYWTKKEEVPIIERNKMMQDAFRKLLDITPEEFAASVYRAKATFAIANPPKSDKTRETIETANRDSYWYIDNKYPALALILNEYGLSYNQYTYSMPHVITDFYHLYMMILHAGYFAELGWTKKLYRAEDNQFDKSAIQQRILQLLAAHKEKFPYLQMDVAKLKYDNLYQFGISYSEQIANFNLDPKKAN
jgi:hypothetical protein